MKPDDEIQDKAWKDNWLPNIWDDAKPNTDKGPFIAQCRGE
jgi:hypothetical protein